MEVESTNECLVVELSLEYELCEAIMIWTVPDGGEAVLVAEIAADGGLASGAGVVVIKDAEGNDVTESTLESSVKYTLYVYYDGADEVHIGSADEGNIIYLANAKC